MAFNRFTKNVLNVSALPDRVQNQAQTLKQTFDKAGVDIKDALNGLIAELEASTSASNIGADVSSVTTKTVQAILTAFELEIAERYTKNEVDTIVSGNTNDLVADVDVNLTTGVITVTKKDGAVERFDTALEKVPAKFEIVEDGSLLYLKITNVDGTSTQTNITDLMNIYDFNNTDDVAFNVSGTGNQKVVTASIRPNSIGLDKLSLSVMTTLEGYMTSARDSASTAKISETNARNSANTATKAAEIASEGAEIGKTAIKKATEAESYAHGGTGTREGEDTDNAKYYSQVAKEVAGGDFVTPTEMEAYAQKKGTSPTYEETALSGEVIETDVPLAMESILKISGNSEQDSRSGKNLLTKNGMSTPTSDSDFWSRAEGGSPQTDGWFKVNYTNSTSSASYLNQFVLKGNINNIEADTTYTIYVEFGNNTTPQAGGRIFISNAHPEEIWSEAWSMPVTEITNGLKLCKTIKTKADISSCLYDLRCFVTALSNEAVSFEYRLMILKGEYTLEQIGDYEPYGVQPSPDYPAEIRSVKSKSDNLFSSEMELGIITGAGVLQDSANAIRTKDFIAIQPNTVYTIQNSNSYRMNAYYYDSSKNYLSTQTVTSGTFTTPENAYFFKIRTSGDLVENDLTTTFMLNKGTEALPYQPYGYVPVEVKVEGKNLVRLKDMEKTTSGVTFVSKNQTITLNGTTTGGNFYPVLPFKVNKNGKYTLTANKISTDENGNCSILLRETDNPESDVWTNICEVGTRPTSSTWTGELNTEKYYSIKIWVGSRTFTNYTFGIQLEEGSIATSYVPYVAPNIVSLPLGDIELRSTPDGTRDTFERVDGVWNKVENIKSINTSTMTWTSRTFEDKGDFWYGYLANALSNGKKISDNKVLSSYFKTLYPRSSSEATVSYLANDISTSSTALYFVILKKDCPSVTDSNNFQTWFRGLNSEIIYALETPTYTPITDTALIQALDTLEQLVLHKGYNRITVTSVNGVKAYLDLAIPSTASVTEVVETQASLDMPVLVVAGDGDVKPKVANQVTVNPSTGEVKIKGSKIAIFDAGEEDLEAGVSELETGKLYFVFE